MSPLHCSCPHFVLVSCHYYFVHIRNPLREEPGQSLGRQTVKGQTKVKFLWDCAYDIPLLSSLTILLPNNDILEAVYILLHVHLHISMASFFLLKVICSVDIIIATC